MISQVFEIKSRRALTLQNYLDLLKKVRDEGIKKEDRTGVGTYSLFGAQLRFDLSKGFPAMTTKKLFFKGVVAELLWFLRGDTNTKYLHDHGVHIWDQWSDSNGELGPIYGHAWRNFGGRPRTVIAPTPQPSPTNRRTYLGIADGAGSTKALLGKVWEGMIARCYDTNNVGFPLYGARGVHVCDRWLEFRYFAEDAPHLPGWDEGKWLNKQLTLDKDEFGDGFKYCPEFCRWVSPTENALFKNRNIYTVEKDGVEYSFRNPSVFCKQQGIDDRNFSDLWTGRKRAQKRYGYSLVSVKGMNSGVDQLARVIESIKNDPDGRRHFITAWHPYWNQYSALPPCHLSFQFYVANGKLSCNFLMRSTDIFLGLPFNIASYALLTHFVARECGLEVGELIYTGGDVHIYSNHIAQVNKQLLREPKSLPKLWLNPKKQKVDEFEIDDIKLENYEYWPTIKAPIAV